jgi:hypothetical protein
MGFDCGQRVELSGTVGDVAIGVAYRGFRLLFWFHVQFEGSERFGISSRLEACLLFFQPDIGSGGTVWCRCGQIITQVIEINQIASLRAELNFHLRRIQFKYA